MRFLFILCLSIHLFGVLRAQNGNNVQFIFHHKGGGEPLELKGSAFPIWNNKSLLLNHAGFYISEIELMRPDSSIVPLTRLHLLVDADADANEYPAGQWDVESIIGLTLHLGVDSAHNHLDPSIYPEGHPLAHQKFQMHWGWLAGYRFMAIEGKVDNNNDNVPESEFQFHNIGDLLYKTVHLSGPAQLENGVLKIHLDLDYARLFQNMPMTGNLIEHGANPANAQMMENAATQGFIRMTDITAAPYLPAAARQITVSPNPVVDGADIRYTLPYPQTSSLLVTNTVGQAVAMYNGLPATGTVRFESGPLPNGVYLCTFYQGGRLVAQTPLIISK